MKPLIYFCLMLVTIVNVAYGQAVGVFETRVLKDLREVAVFIHVQNENNCEINRDEVRRDVINRIVPAGLRIVEQNAGAALNISIVAVSPRSTELCGASYSLELLYNASIVFVDPFLIQSRWVPSFSRSGVATAASSRYSGYMRGIINNQLDAFLADWRLVNAGADFVRQAPAASVQVTQPNTPTAGPNIRTVQSRLQALGHYQGAIDGISGIGTRTAIQVFQRSVGLPATGDLDAETMRRLFP